MPSLELPSGAPTLADAVAQAVRDGVAAGELVPATTYSVYQLASLLGVSRSPVREGLLRLAEAGLVSIRRNRGFQVLPPRAEDIEEIMDIRLALEPAAARRAAASGSPDLLRQIGLIQEKMGQSAPEADFWPADRALHDLILRTANRPRTAELVERLRTTTALLGPPTTAGARTLAEIHAEHQPVVAAILARDGDAAEASMRVHLEATKRALLTLTPIRPGSEKQPR